MYALKWMYPHQRMLFYPEDGGGSAGPAPSGGGGGGDSGSSVAAPADTGGGSSGGEVSGSGSAPADSGGSPVTSAPGTGAPDWAKLGSVDDLDYVEIQAEQTEPKPLEAPPATPTAPPVQEPPPVTAAPTTPGEQGGQQAAAPPLSASDPMGIAAGLEAHRDAVLAHLAQSKFALTEQEVQELETDVISAMPKVMSRVFFESQVSMQKFLAQAVPGMVKQFQQVSRANQDAEQMFFSANKALDINNPSHREAAIRIATVYRQANPNIPMNQLISEVGSMVTSALKLNGHARPVAVAPQPRGGTPFRPAVGGSGAAPNPEPMSEWGGLGQQFD